MQRQPMIAALCGWFEREARPLPWRKPRMRTGYPALVAEMMLQQTQVSRVAERYVRFMRAFPSAAALARAEEQEVLAHWQGLGYYRRAQHLHAAARMIVREFAGRVPRRVEDLMRLPGVGRYTAGSIASIIFGQPEPIVDGNVERVLWRLSAARWPTSMTPAQRRKVSWNVAEDLVMRSARPGVLNEALMELGATVCLPLPARPRCDACPVARWCEAKQAGTQIQFPPPRVRANSLVVHHHAVVVRRGASTMIMLQQRGHDGMWSGLWQVPTLEARQPMTIRAIRSALAGTQVGTLDRCGEFTHKTTHRLIRFHVYRGASKVRWGYWHDVNDLDRLPMSSAQRRAVTLAMHLQVNTSSGRR